VRLPEITVTHSEFTSQFGFSGTDSLVDKTMRDFLELLKAISDMAQLETAVFQLARELKRTQRRVNALEQIFIPDFRDTLKYIGDSLESKELESFFVLKLIKKRLGEKG
jgi:V/A-type H+/Na+-transporting ATPase subunit D